jgi:hypothetical protein
MLWGAAARNSLLPQVPPPACQELSRFIATRNMRPSGPRCDQQTGGPPRPICRASQWHAASASWPYERHGGRRHQPAVTVCGAESFLPRTSQSSQSSKHHHLARPPSRHLSLPFPRALPWEIAGPTAAANRPPRILPILPILPDILVAAACSPAAALQATLASRAEARTLSFVNIHGRLLENFPPPQQRLQSTISSVSNLPARSQKYVSSPLGQLRAATLYSKTGSCGTPCMYVRRPKTVVIAHSFRNFDFFLGVFFCRICRS